MEVAEGEEWLLGPVNYAWRETRDERRGGRGEALPRALGGASVADEASARAGAASPTFTRISWRRKGCAVVWAYW